MDRDQSLRELVVNRSEFIHQNILRLSGPIRKSLEEIRYKPPEGRNVSVKSILESLLPGKNQDSIIEEIRDFCLCCASLASAQGENGIWMSWIPRVLSASATSSIEELSQIIFTDLDVKSSKNDLKLILKVMPDVMPTIKKTIKDSSVDLLENEMAASANVPVGFAVVAAYQFRWFVTQINLPHLGKLSSLVIPCGLTALDHWSSDVKGQGMIGFIHLAKNVNAYEIGLYEDVILDASCQNIACSDELWHWVVEMSVLFVTCFHQRNPRSSWYEKMMNEMLCHLERQPRNQKRRILWLQLIEPFFKSMGLVLLAHFRRIFALFFNWMHSHDEETVILVLERIQTILKLTWIRNTPYIERLVDELIVTYKESSLQKRPEEIQVHLRQILIFLQKCKMMQFEAAWEKHKDDPSLASLLSDLIKCDSATLDDRSPILSN